MIGKASQRKRQVNQDQDGEELSQVKTEWVHSRRRERHVHSCSGEDDNNKNMVLTKCQAFLKLILTMLWGIMSFIMFYFFFQNWKPRHRKVKWAPRGHPASKRGSCDSLPGGGHWGWNGRVRTRMARDGPGAMKRVWVTSNLVCHGKECEFYSLCHEKLSKGFKQDSIWFNVPIKKPVMNFLFLKIK